MARYTSAYSSFISRLDEVNILRRFAYEKERSNPIKYRSETDALCRGAVVLLSGHLEAFVKELGEVALDSMHLKKIPRNNVSSSLYYHISKDFLDELQNTSDPTRIAEKVFNFVQSDLVYWSRTGPFSEPIPTDRFNKGFSNPAFDKIRQYFNRFGYSDYQRDLARSLKAQFQPTKNMVDHLVDTRNKIAHGDPTATKTPSEIKTMMEIIRTYCTVTDSVFAAWWKTNYCSIR